MLRSDRLKVVRPRSAGLMFLSFFVCMFSVSARTVLEYSVRVLYVTVRSLATCNCKKAVVEVFEFLRARWCLEDVKKALETQRFRFGGKRKNDYVVRCLLELRVVVARFPQYCSLRDFSTVVKKYQKQFTHSWTLEVRSAKGRGPQPANNAGAG